MKVILPIIFLTLLRLQYVLSSTSHNSIIFGHSIRADNQGYGRYRSSLANLLGTFASQITNPGFYNFTTSFPKAPTQLYGHYLCRGDVDHQACQSCINFAKNDMLKSHYPNGSAGLAWYDHCMIRFSNQSFFGKLDFSTGSFIWDDKYIARGSHSLFMAILQYKLENLAIRASNGHNTKRFVSVVVKVPSFETYMAVQCTPDLVASACYRCLANANMVLLGMGGRARGHVYYSSCMAEYNTTFALTHNKVVKPKSLSIPISPEDTNSTLIIKMRGTDLPDNDRSE